MSPETRGLVLSIRYVGDRTGTKLKEYVYETFTPEMIFHPNISAFANVWNELRRFLAARNVTMHVHERHRAVYYLALSIFDDDAKMTKAMNLAKRALSLPHGPPIPPHHDRPPNSHAVTNRGNGNHE